MKNITTNSSSNKKRTERENRQHKRLQQLKDLYEIFYEDCKPFLTDVALNKNLLEIVVISIHEDLYRFENYTASMCADRHKQAAYTIKWISKIKPVQIITSDKEIDRYSLFVNSSFAIFAGLSFLNGPIYIPPEYHEFLIYSTYYRNLSGKQLAGSLLFVGKVFGRSKFKQIQFFDLTTSQFEKLF
jgi:hypothetical protein